MNDTPQTLRAGLLGEHLSHSFSPRIHALLTDAYTYDLFERPPEAVGDFIRHGKWDALNVTIPYKKTVLPLMDVLSPAARAVGSVNTVVRLPDGRLYGDNTDPVGFSALLDDLLSDPLCPLGPELVGKKALVLGSGGASLTAQTVLGGRGMRVVVISRTGDENYETVYARHADAALLVNATPVGMYPHTDASPMDLTRLPSLGGVIDMIYNPLRTRLLLAAADLGIANRNGLLMLTAQAAAAQDRFLGRIPADGADAYPSDAAAYAARVRAMTARLVSETENLILIGMPGCGKTTVGRALAARLGRPFIDTDDEITRAAEMTIPEIFRTRGEAAFRRIEADVIARITRENGGTPGHASSPGSTGLGAVISTGGGCLTTPGNRESLRQNGIVIFLTRPLPLLAREGRPLSADPSADLAAMYDRRLPLYKAAADLIISNDGTPDSTADAIIRALGLT